MIDSAGARRADVLVDGELVASVGTDIEPPGGTRVLDASGCFVMPGLVDLHTHLREPGAEESETIGSGARAAARGGFTAVVAMPNTDPPIDSAECVRYVAERARDATCEVVIAGAITLGRQGERLAPMGEMVEAGVRIFTDDGAGVQDPLLMRRAMEYAGALGAVVAEHCEDERLAASGHMHEGRWSSLLGVPGIPAEAEEVMAARDIALARRTGCPLHLLHVSTAGTVELVRGARAQGVPVTCEVAPHHIGLTDAEVASYDPLFKVNPPLRSPEHVRALIEALLSGEIDAVATDHAPHPLHTKEQPFDQAPCGMLGLETALPVVFTVLTSGSGLSADLDGTPVVAPREALSLLVSAMSAVPARIASVGDRHGGPVVAGAYANLCIFDPSVTWVVDRTRLVSRSSNSPWDGHKLTGAIRHTVYRGEAVVVDGEVQR